MFDRVIYMPPKILNFQSEAKRQQIIATVTTCSVSRYFSFIFHKMSDITKFFQIGTKKCDLSVNLKLGKIQRKLKKVV